MIIDSANCLKWLRAFASKWLGPTHASNITLHSWKATMLSIMNQLLLSKDLRAPQGHHKMNSVALYGRDDVWLPLAGQRIVRRALLSGWRPSRPQYRGGQCPVSEPGVALTSLQEMGDFAAQPSFPLLITQWPPHLCQIPKPMHSNEPVSSGPVAPDKVKTPDQADSNFLGWQQQRNGSWTHQAVPRQCIRWTQNLQLDRLKHLLREAWRFRRFDAWRTSGRLDAVAAGNPIFQPARLKQASQLWSATCAHGRAVLTAAVVSPARLQSQLTGHAELWCPFCRECYAPTWDHCAWSCAHFRASRPNLPADSMQRRIGWPLPARTKIHNLRVLDHLASVRQALVDYRCM